MDVAFRGMSWIIPHSRNVAARSALFRNYKNRGRIIGCRSRNDAPTSSKGAAEITVAGIAARNPGFASLISKARLAARAKTSRM
jgi:hypothetical protein